MYKVLLCIHTACLLGDRGKRAIKEGRQGGTYRSTDKQQQRHGTQTLLTDTPEQRVVQKAAFCESMG